MYHRQEQVLLARLLQVVRAALTVKPLRHTSHWLWPAFEEKRWPPFPPIPVHRLQLKSPLPAFAVPACGQVPCPLDISRAAFVLVPH